MLESSNHFFASASFLPHGYCYQWKSALVWLHVTSDSAIAIAYYAMAIALVYLICKQPGVPFPRILITLAAFLMACGTAHLMEIWTLWHPDYWLSGGIKAIAAIVSLYAAATLFALIPKALASPTKPSHAPCPISTLPQSETHFRLIFENAAIGIALKDVSGQFVETNPAFQKLFGYSENDLSRMHFTQLTHPEAIDIEEVLYQEMVDGLRDGYELEKRYHHQNGQLLWGHLTVSLVHDTQGNPQFSIATVENITTRKQAEAALRHYQEHLEELVGARTAELTEANKQLSWQANHDPLTGLVNRREFERCLETAIASARTSQQEHTLCYMDLDRFKIINDTCGHRAGDELLRQISRLLQNHSRKTDTLARLGGDEFGLLLYQCSLKEAQRVVHILHQSIQDFRLAWQDKTFNIGVSIGLVAIDAGSLSPEDVLNAADTACYSAKHQGRNQVRVYQAEGLKV